MIARIETQCAVIGAGVVGLAIARSLAVRGLEVVTIEAANAIGTGISSRNSEVIHAGLYYDPGSLKAQLCIEGKERLYRYCQSRAIAHRQVGKLIVATDEAQRPALAALQAQAAACGVTDLVELTPRQVRAIEPHVRCKAALLSPSTGIVDSHALMQSLHAEAQAAGAMVAFNTPVQGGQTTKDGVELDCGGADPVRLCARLAVNAAGLGAQAISRALLGLPAETIPSLYYAKGNYFALAGRSPFLRLVYPLPQKAGLGVHVTLDLAGQARFGPDVEWIDAVHYPVDPSRSGPFYAAIRRYWPGLPDGALQPAYAGIRPKLTGPGQDAVDFCLHGPERHGITGLVCLYGIESPGLTAALAIAERVAGLLTKRGMR